MIKIYTLLALTLLFSACSTLKIDTDFDSKYDFSAQKTYAVVHENKESDNSLINDRIKNAIEKNIESKNYKKVSKKEADLIFVFHVNVMNMSDVRKDYRRVGYPNYGYGGAWGGYGYGAGTMIIATPSVYKWKEGKLIIDALNPKTKKIVWRGIVKDELSNSTSSSEEKTKYLNTVVYKLLKSFPKN